MSAYKYSGYTLLKPILTLEDHEMVNQENSPFILLGTILLNLTCKSTQHNTEEFIKEDGVTIIYNLLTKCLVNEDISENSTTFQVVQSCVHTISDLSLSDKGITAMLNYPNLFSELSRYCRFTHIPSIVKYSLTAIARLSRNEKCQEMLISGYNCVLWSIIPLLFRYDSTQVKDEDKNENDEELTNNIQLAANEVAELATYTLSRLSGYLPGKLSTPIHPLIRNIVRNIFTASISDLLQNEDAKDFLEIITFKIETPYMIWNKTMMEQLLNRVSEVDRAQLEVGKSDISILNDFRYSSLEKELYIGSVYIRVYINTPSFKISKEEKFCVALLDYIEEQKVNEENELYRTKYRNQVRDTIKSLILILKQNKELSVFISKRYTLLFSFLLPDSQGLFNPEDELRDIVLVLISLSIDHQSCLAVFLNEQLTPILLHLILSNVPSSLAALQIILPLLEKSDVIRVVIDYSGHLLFLCLLMSSDENNSRNMRSTAALCLSRILNDNVEGHKMMLFVRRFLPQILAFGIKEQPDLAIKKIEINHETPEIIWTDNMRIVLRTNLSELLHQLDQSFKLKLRYDFPEKYKISYEELKNEINVGGVYLRLFLKDPKYTLRAPKIFIESSLKLLCDEGKKEIKRASGGMPEEDEIKYDIEKDATQVDELKDKLFNVLASCLVCAIRTNVSLIDHVAYLGYISKLVGLLQKSAEVFPHGDLTDAIIRILRECSRSKMCVDKFEETEILAAVKMTLEPLGPEAGTTLEAISLLLDNKSSLLVEKALEDDYIDLLMNCLDNPMKEVIDVATAKVMCVNILKRLSKDKIHGKVVQEKLDEYDKWSEYKHQKHDLFISKNPKSDHYLRKANDTLAIEDKK